MNWMFWKKEKSLSKIPITRTKKTPKLTYADTARYDDGVIPCLTRKIVLNVLYELDDVGLLASSLEYNHEKGGVGRVWRPSR